MMNFYLGKFALLFFVLLCLDYTVRSAYYNNNVAITYLYVQDAELTNEFTNTVNRQPVVKEMISPYPFLKYIYDWGPLLQTHMQTIENVNNPLNQYFILWRFYSLWPEAMAEMKTLVNSPDFKKKAQKHAMLMRFEAHMEDFRNKIALIAVNDEEVRRGAKGLLRLQEVYHLRPLDLILGQVKNYPAVRRLGDEEAIWILNSAYSIQNTCGLVMWGADMLEANMNVPQLYLDIIRSTSREETCDKYYCARDSCDPHDSDSRNYVRLCNHESDYTEKTLKSKLKCYIYAPHEALILQPVNAEMLNDNPVIWKFHKMFTSRECDSFWATSFDKQADSGVGDQANIKAGTEIRVGTNAWMTDDYSEIIQRFSNRVHQVTGLLVEGQEQWQVASYGIGGHYWIHHDDFENGTAEASGDQGNRMATLMVYLSEVQQGGATAFPRAETVSFPGKGDAVFWFSLDTWEDRVTGGLHGGCPVLIGSKKIGNKWIRFRDQYKTHKCYQNRLHKMPSSKVRYS